MEWVYLCCFFQKKSFCMPVKIKDLSPLILHWIDQTESSPATNYYGIKSFKDKTCSNEFSQICWLFSKFGSVNECLEARDILFTWNCKDFENGKLPTQNKIKCKFCIRCSLKHTIILFFVWSKYCPICRQWRKVQVTLRKIHSVEDFIWYAYCRL